MDDLKIKKKRNKTTILIILFLILSVLSVLLFVFRSHPPEFLSDTDDENIELLKFELSDIKSFTYTIEGQEHTFYKKDSKWVYKEDGSMKFDQKAIEEMLSSVASLTATARISEKDDKLETYGLDKPQFILVLDHKDGHKESLKAGIENPMMAITYVTISSKEGIYGVEFSPENLFRDPVTMRAGNES